MKNLKSLIQSCLKTPLIFALLVTAMFVGDRELAHAQLTRDHKLLHSKMPPGIVSQRKLVGNAPLVGHIQPLRMIAPDGSRISILAGGTTTEAIGSRVTVGAQAGLVYRFRVDFTELETRRTLYPSVEIVDRLYPPPGLENQFPVPVVISESDLAQASGGKLVTKVIYLERAESTVPRRAVETDQPWFDVTGSEDPLHVAESLGRPLAILRIGSRIPTADELSGPSAFNSAMPVLLPTSDQRVPTSDTQKQKTPNPTINLSDQPR